jgi:hypothetical protein
MSSYLMAEFETPEALAGAITKLQEQGRHELDAYTPYSTEVVREALGWKRSRLPVAIFAVGISAAGSAYLLQWYLVGYLYPLNVGGRPPHMPLAFVPITFEMGVLFAGFTALLGVCLLGRLLKLWDPVFEVPGFVSASDDKFWLRVELPEQQLEDPEVRQTLEACAALSIIAVRGEAA